MWKRVQGKETQRKATEKKKTQLWPTSESGSVDVDDESLDTDVIMHEEDMPSKSGLANGPTKIATRRACGVMDQIINSMRLQIVSYCRVVHNLLQMSLVKDVAALPCATPRIMDSTKRKSYHLQILTSTPKE